MQLSVEHSTVYPYDDSVFLEPHTFRLRPRRSASQRLLQFDLQISLEPAGTAECMDQDGNLALQVRFGGATRELNVRSRFRVELPRDNAFDYDLDAKGSPLSLWFPEPLSTALTPYRNFATVPDPVREFAQAIAGRAHFDLLLFLNQLNWEIFSQFRQVVRLEGPAWPSEMTLRMGDGSYPHLAVLFRDACRVLGIAARFVSGYECATAGRPDASMHAWAEVYLPAIGWRGYDPELATPISGLYTGRGGSRMETYLHMDVEGLAC